MMDGVRPAKRHANSADSSNAGEPGFYAKLEAAGRRSEIQGKKPFRLAVSRGEHSKNRRGGKAMEPGRLRNLHLIDPKALKRVLAAPRRIAYISAFVAAGLSYRSVSFLFSMAKTVSPLLAKRIRGLARRAIAPKKSAKANVPEIKGITGALSGQLNSENITIADNTHEYRNIAQVKPNILRRHVQVEEGRVPSASGDDTGLQPQLSRFFQDAGGSTNRTVRTEQPQTIASARARIIETRRKLGCIRSMPDGDPADHGRFDIGYLSPGQPRALPGTAFFADLAVHASGFFNSLLTRKKARPKRSLRDAFDPASMRLRLRAAFAFAMIAIIIASSVQVLVVFGTFDAQELSRGIIRSGKLAASNMANASQEAARMNFRGAGENFREARRNFDKAENMITDLEAALLELAKFAPIASIRLIGHGTDALEAGKAAATLGEKLAGSLDCLTGSSSGRSAMPEGSTPLYAEADYGKCLLMIEAAAKDANMLDEFFSGIESRDLPAKYSDSILLAKGKAHALSAMLEEAGLASRALYEITGGGGRTRYLVFFQNSAEMRPTGGFLGSYALADFDSGALKKIEVPGGGTYDSEGSLKEFVAAPEPLRLLRPRWFLWDANWWPDWDKSASKLVWFYEKSGGATVDGAIALTPKVIEDVLSAIGPVRLADPYNIDVSSYNFYDTTQAYTEDKHKGSSTPKRIIGDLAAKMLEVLPGRINKDTAFALIDAISENLERGDILIYSKDSKTSQYLAQRGWDGRIAQTQGDYLKVVDTNIGGGKSDRDITESISHTAEIGEDGSIIDTLRITRRHLGTEGAGWSGVRNVDWLRVYVPEGSVLIESGGFLAPDQTLFEQPEPWYSLDPDLAPERRAEIDPSTGTRIYSELGKTVFANWCMLDPGETIEIYYKYKLPGKFLGNSIKQDRLGKQGHFRYSIYFEKQEGAKDLDVTSSVIAFQGSDITWKDSRYSAEGSTRLQARIHSGTDILLGAIFELK